MPRPHRLLAPRGFTLVEALLALAVAAIVLGLGLPSLQDLLERRRVEGAAARLAADLHYARLEAVTRHRLVRFAVFGNAASGSCYLVYTGELGACRCSADGRPACGEGARSLRTTAFPVGGGLRVEANVAALSFDPLHGTSTPAGTLKLLGARDHGVQHVVNLMGRVRSCAVRAPMPGLGAC